VNNICFFLSPDNWKFIISYSNNEILILNLENNSMNNNNNNNNSNITLVDCDIHSVYSFQKGQKLLVVTRHKIIVFDINISLDELSLKNRKDYAIELTYVRLFDENNYMLAISLSSFTLTWWNLNEAKKEWSLTLSSEIGGIGHFIEFIKADSNQGIRNNRLVFACDNGAVMVIRF